MFLHTEIKRKKTSVMFPPDHNVSFFLLSQGQKKGQNFEKNGKIFNKFGKISKSS